MKITVLDEDIYLEALNTLTARTEKVTAKCRIMITHDGDMFIMRKA